MFYFLLALFQIIPPVVDCTMQRLSAGYRPKYVKENHFSPLGLVSVIGASCDSILLFVLSRKNFTKHYQART